MTPLNYYGKNKKNIICAIAALLLATSALADSGPAVQGTYSDSQLLAVKRLTLPRIHLYDQSGRLIERSNWPAELDNIRRQAGEAFCCVSDKPRPLGSSGPPPDCKLIVYGADVREHFVELQSALGTPITYESLPPHKYLIVDYFADWCAPCIPTRHALDEFLKTKEGAEYAVVIVDFSRLPKAQELARSARSE